MLRIYLTKAVHTNPNTQPLWVILKILWIVIHIVCYSVFNLPTTTPICFPKFKQSTDSNFK